MTAAPTAVQKPETSNGPTIRSVSHNMNALTNRSAMPRVRITAGSARKITSGRTMAFTSPKTSPASTRTQKLPS